MVGDDANQKLLLALLDAGVEFLVAGGMAAGRPKDQMVLPILLATLEARERGK